MIPGTSHNFLWFPETINRAEKIQCRSFPFDIKDFCELFETRLKLGKITLTNPEHDEIFCTVVLSYSGCYIGCYMGYYSWQKPKMSIRNNKGHIIITNRYC